MDKIILQEQRAISNTTDVAIKIEDSVGGDMIFNFSLVKNEQDGDTSYTRLETINEHEANITISNAPVDTSIQSAEVRVGTFGENSLPMYMTFRLTAILTEGYRNISVNFYVKEK